MRRRTAARVLLLGAALAGLAACGSAPPSDSTTPRTASPAASASPSPSGPTAIPAYPVGRLIHPSSADYLGEFPDSRPGSLAAVRRFAASIGRKPNIIGIYVAWNSPFEARAVASNWSYSALTYMAWEPFGTTLRSIAQGKSDTYITTFAKAVRALNLPVAISFGHEMNGDWYPWGTTKATPGQFVGAWRRIHDLFEAADARNVIWIWNPNVISPAPQVQLQPYYPGDSYVDWVGVTGYFPSSGAQAFSVLFDPTMHEIRAFTHKPFIVAETSVETGPADVTCVDQLVSSVIKRSHVLGFIWFDFNKDGVDWRAESRPPVRAALAHDIATMKLVSVN